MTQNTKHTPGPWRYGLATGSFSHYRVDAGDKTPVIAAVIESEDDARLIAAAPESMAANYLALDTLESLAREGVDMTTFNEGGLGFDAIQTLRAAIAKATGDASVIAADNLSHSALLDAAREGIALGEDDGQ